MREVTVGEVACAELLGTGDILRPWTGAGAEPPRSRPWPGWEALEDVRLAVLDPRFALQIARWPQVSATIVDRVVIRARWLAFHLAVCHVVGIEKRLVILFWHLADRWGKVTPEGVRIELPALARHDRQARRLAPPDRDHRDGQAARRGHDPAHGEGAWLLCGSPPDDLRNVRGSVGARELRKDISATDETPKDPGGE